MIKESVYYTFDGNRRVYPKDSSISCGPIYSEHFKAHPVIEENDKEIICENQFHINKRSMKGYYGYGRDKYAVFTQAERDADIWLKEHRYKIIRVFESCHDPDIIKQVASLLKYDDKLKVVVRVARLK